MKDLATKKRHLAIHEAGHAVMHCLLHRINPAAFPLLAWARIFDGFRGGAVTFSPGDWWQGPHSARLSGSVALCMVSMAGPVAEFVHFGRWSGSYTKTDLRDVHRALNHAGVGRIERVLLIEQLQAETQALLSRPDVRAATVACADALVERRRLSGREVMGIIRQTVREINLWEHLPHLKTNI